MGLVSVGTAATLLIVFGRKDIDPLLPYSITYLPAHLPAYPIAIVMYCVPMLGWLVVMMRWVEGLEEYLRPNLVTYGRLQW